MSTSNYSYHSNDLILAINPRIPFTKIEIFKGETQVFLKKIKHERSRLDMFTDFADQTEFRVKSIMDELKYNEIDIENLRAVIGRGGLLKPLESGVYEINEAILHDLRTCKYGEDVVNLGAMIAHEVAKKLPEAYAFIADPVTVDEFQELARFSGHPDYPRRSVFHALNQKAIGRKHAKLNSAVYEEMNLIIAHLSSGITIGAHEKGKVVDATQGLDGDGPFAPFRSGTLPVGDLIRACYRGNYSEKQMLESITKCGGMFAYLGTYSVIEAERMAEKGDEEAEMVLEAMAYQVAKNIAALFPTMNGKVDAILITGAMAQSDRVSKAIVERVKNMAPVHVYPGVDELSALANNALLALRGKIEIKKYL